MTVLVEIARFVTGMLVVLTGHFLLPCLVAVAVLVEITGLVPRMIVMLAGLLLCHFCSP
jgi:ascorbate-specific PTS system EIIC-type component UlaA